MRLKEVARKVEDGIEETLTYCDFPSEHRTRVRTNNAIGCKNRHPSPICTRFEHHFHALKPHLRCLSFKPPRRSARPYMFKHGR